MRIAEIIGLLEILAPAAWAEPWDNVGLQVGDPDAETNGCLLALDPSLPAIRETRQCGAALLITHHPLIFEPLRSVSAEHPAGAMILAAARVGVSVYALHTNLDASLVCGTAAALADRLGLQRGPALVPGHFSPTLQAASFPLANPYGPNEASQDNPAQSAKDSQQLPGGMKAGESLQHEENALSPGQLQVTPNGAQAGPAGPKLPPPANQVMDHGLGMLTTTPPITLDALAGYAATRLGCKHATVTGVGERTVERVALMPGAGGGVVAAAASVADVLITGEIKYHEALRAQDLGLAVIALGHYATERPVLDLLARHLRSAGPAGFQVAISQHISDPFRQTQ